jgi:DNA invertase Pin-like site-specific DNA recombinase
MKAAIYARYSSENQRDASIADQFRICRELAQRQGWHIAAEYSDHAVSGATIMRPGFQAMMREALQKKFDIVMAEALDCFSRDQEDTAGLFKRLTFAGVNIVTLAEGDITHLHIGLKGTMNALFLKELAEKTRRGLRGRIELGKQAAVSASATESCVDSRTALSPPVSERSCPRRPPSFYASSTTTGLARHRSRSRKRSMPKVCAAAWSALEPEHDSRKSGAWRRHSPQRAVHRSSGVESAAVPEGSGHRQACRTDESAV